MRTLKKTALFALTIATLGGVAGMANAGVASPRDSFTDGAHAMGTRDPFSDGSHAMGTRDPFSDGSHSVGARDNFTDGV